ncbi:hypothetical protein RHO14_07050 [Orbus wheelerorum]|uniref:baseplate complex protein n=1 Tax=Orbus wheelerorum TaxID=3074111 RepID=UPI00370DDFE7
MSSTNVLALDGEAIQIKNPQIVLKETIAEEDQSGQSSSTTASEQGQKAKVLSVSGVIEYTSVACLTRLFELAGQRTESGAKKVYRIANSLALAVKFRQGVFSGEISATPDSKFLAWNVSFTLKERFSVPEKKEAIKQSDSGELIIDDDKADDKADLNGFEENMLNKIDKALS